MKQMQVIESLFYHMVESFAQSQLIKNGVSRRRYEKAGFIFLLIFIMHFYASISNLNALKAQTAGSARARARQEKIMR